MAQPVSLNLNNEVVKMRKEVKRTRVLIIRKLVRSVGRLKSKKGTEDALLKNQRRAQRLLEEIHAMKELKPDTVTKSALGEDISFEKICKKPDSTASERAIARLAEHPFLKKKIDTLKAAVQAFKDARQNGTEVKNTTEENHSKNTLYSVDEESKSQRETTKITDQKGKEAKIQAKELINNSKEKKPKMEHGPKAVNISSSLSKLLEKESVAPSESQKTPADPHMKALSHVEKKKGSDSLRDDNSDSQEDLCEEEEKEYFDDSTEERFYKQSSMSEDSDSGDDFFIGKVRRTRKKESGCYTSAAEHKPLQQVLPKEDMRATHWDGDVRNDKNKPSTEARKFESVFFHSLSGSKSSRREYREQAPKSKVSDFPENEPPVKNQFKKNTQRRLENTKHPLNVPLHPSWEASRKRKEQQSKIAVFQGKKIIFDD
ncbi:serum response factor-binding protein 1 isoform X2 [Cavia porcellus]|uniref:Serum response factor-binding protein 1 n=1 Tax=Cavia porcellus TaxID=10141 RepID=H0V3R0_CAVPO|nr:serum response factor-binding protein 1 isoform X2 [Cavia porcellus]